MTGLGIGGSAAWPERPETPRLRGRLHELAFAASIPAGAALVAVARTTPGRIAALVYWLSLSGLYGTSAAFHLVRWSRAAHRRMDQADHAMIYVLIAGTYTPFALLAMDRRWGVVVLGVVWTLAVAGIGVVIRWHRIKIVGITLYLTMGWLAVVTVPWMARRLGPVKLALLFAGGLLYTVGVVVLDRQRPNPRPQVFGYHEVWHVFTVAAGICHFVLTWLLVTEA